MSSDDPPPPPVFTLTPPETPLDLTTARRADVVDDDSLIAVPYGKHTERHMSLPTDLDYQYGQLQNRMLYTGDTMSETNSTKSPYSSQNDLSPASSATTSRSGAPSPTFYGSSSYYGESGKNGEPSSFEGSILPKKRKNLWRPYDSRMAFGLMDKDCDSSDSASGSSDQEFKSPSMDPVKKRKLHMMQYSSGENECDGAAADNAVTDVATSEQYQCRQPLDASSSHVHTSNQSATAIPVKTSEAWVAPRVSCDPSSGYFTHVAEELTKSQLSLLNGYPEARDKMISGLKKRDIFGWGLKLMKSSSEGSNTTRTQEPSPVVETNSSQDSAANNNVCQDGEKTYIELQTVKAASPPSTKPTENVVDSAQESTATKAPQSPFKSPKPYVGKPDSSPSKSPSPSKVAGQHKTGAIAKTNTNDSSENDNDTDSEKENVDGNNSNTNNKTHDGKVYIQTRDNVIKTFDETKNVPVKTKKGISLIDLVEEIEASALAERLDFENEAARNARNKRVTALLEQCNHVKLQALDFLMANVLIQEREPQYKQRNEKVQKMLKGDKISSVNMLDVLELQVEVGLN